MCFLPSMGSTFERQKCFPCSVRSTSCFQLPSFCNTSLCMFSNPEQCIFHVLYIWNFAVRIFFAKYVSIEKPKKYKLFSLHQCIKMIQLNQLYTQFAKLSSVHNTSISGSSREQLKHRKSSPSKRVSTFR